MIVSEVVEERLEQAGRHGADVLVNPQHTDLKTAVMQASGGRGASVVIVATAAPRAQTQALDLAARRGRINLFGGLPKDRPWVEFDANLIHYKQLLVTGTTGANVRQFRSAVNLIVAGRLPVASLIGARLPLDRLREGIARSQTGRDLRIVVEPGG